MLRRLLGSLVALVLASIAIFLLIHLIPGSPAVALAGQDASPAAVARINHDLGLDRPLPLQYWAWSTSVLQGNLGRSYIIGAPISQLIAARLGNSIELMFAAMVLALVFGFAMGMTGALTRSYRLELALTSLNAGMISVPPFVAGILLILILAVALRILPASGQVAPNSDPLLSLKYLILPALTLAIPAAAVIARFLQTSLRQTMTADYIWTAVAKGLRPRRIVLRHALPAAVAPVVTIVGIQIGQLLGGAVLVETVFAWPGLARLLLDAVLSHDYILVQDVLLFSVIVFLLLQLATDIVHARLDPRLTVEG